MQSDMMSDAGVDSLVKKDSMQPIAKKQLAQSLKYEYKSNHEPRPGKHVNGA